MTENKNLVVKIVVLFISSILLVSLVFSGVLFAFFYFSDSSSVQQKTTTRYKKHTVDENTGEISTGIVSMFEDLEGDEFLTYESDDGEQHTIISNFESGNYKCTAACLCMDTEGRRLASHHHQVLGKTFITLIAAFSSVLAFQKAKDYLDDECKERFRNECPENAIIAEVKGDCKDIENNKPAENEEEEGESGLKIWICEGNCMDLEIHDIITEDTIDCAVLEIRESFALDVEEDPKNYFLDTYLDSFCDNSHTPPECQADLLISCVPVPGTIPAPQKEKVL